MGSKQDLRSGLDVTDVTTLVCRLQELHQVTVSLVMSLDGAYIPFRMQVVAIATRRAGVSGGLKRSVSRKRFYPSNDAGSFEALLFRLLYELDRDCAEMWDQSEFFT